MLPDHLISFGNVNAGGQVKVGIARDASQKTHKLMAAQFPGQWDIVTVEADELIHAIDDADVTIPEGAAIDEGLLKQAKNLKLIQTGDGYDNIKVDACTQRGIWIANAAGVKRVMAGKPPQNALNEPTENNLKWNG